MVAPDPTHFIFSHASSYRTSRLPSPTNNNKSGKSSPFLLQYSRKRSSNLLPPLGQGDHQRARRSRVRTVPSSRTSSSKLSRLEVEPVLGKRSRSASEEVASQPSLEVRGTESLLQFQSSEDVMPLYTSANTSATPYMGRPRRLAKVETIRVLRARSALLLPLSSPSIPSLPSSMSVQPLLLKSEDRKKKRR